MPSLLRRLWVKRSVRYAQAIVARALDDRLRDGRETMKKSPSWREIGRDVQRGASTASRAIASVPIGTSGETYVKAVVAALDRALDGVQESGDDEHGLRAGTIRDIRADIVKRSGFRI